MFAVRKSNCGLEWNRVGWLVGCDLFVWVIRRSYYCATSTYFCCRQCCLLFAGYYHVYECSPAGRCQIMKKRVKNAIVELQHLSYFTNQWLGYCAHRVFRSDFLLGFLKLCQSFHVSFPNCRNAGRCKMATPNSNDANESIKPVPLRTETRHQTH